VKGVKGVQMYGFFIYFQFKKLCGTGYWESVPHNFTFVHAVLEYFFRHCEKNVTTASLPLQ